LAASRPSPPPSRRARGVRIAAAAWTALRRVLSGGWDFIKRVYFKAEQDDIFFLAGAVAFNLLLAAAPFILLLVSIFSLVLSRVVENPRRVALEYVFRILPPTPAVERATIEIVRLLLEGSTGYGLLGLGLFVWTSTRLSGTLRGVLKSIFDLPEERDIIRGKLFDLGMVLIAGTLFLLNTGISLVLEAVNKYGIHWLGVEDYVEVKRYMAFWPRLAAFLFIYLMFLLMYRFLPKRRTPWKTALVAASFASVAWELLKGLFSWYFGSGAGSSRVYGALLAPVLLMLWVYYSALVFMLGGEVGQVYDLLRVRRRQREMLE
jgi:membrane protein